MSVFRLYTYIYITIFFFVFLKTDSPGQNINISVKHPPSFQFYIEDLWNITLINSSNPVNVYLLSTVENSSSQIILEAKTSKFDLPTGTMSVNANQIGPIDVKEYSKDIKRTLNRTGTFPSGNYRVCVSAISSESNQTLSSTCNDYDILNLSQPELISPLNGETIRDRLPVFNWHSPMPLPPGRKVTYEITIVEVLKNQTVFQALQSNPTLVKKGNIFSVLFQYPITERDLESGKQYVWIVKAFLDGSCLTESEAWEFKYESGMPVVFELEEQTKNKLENKFPEEEFIKFREKNNLEKDNKYLSNYLRTKHKRFSINKDINLIKRSTGSKTALEYRKGFYSHRIKLLNKAGKRSTGESQFKLLNSYSILNYQYSNRQMIGSEIPKNFLSLRFDPTFTVFELPLTFNLYLDTKQSSERQNVNNYSLFLEPYLLRDIIAKKKKENKSVNGFLKFMSDFKTLKVGEIYPYYSNYTLNGSRVTGGDIAYNPGWFYIALSGLNNLKAIEGYNYSRKLMAGKIGAGSMEESHFHITVLKAWDDENSLSPEQATNGITPQENFLFGTEGKLKFLNGRLIFEGEIVGSMYTRDITSPALESEDIPGFLSFILDTKISSSFDYMYSIKSIYDIIETQTKITGEYKSIGPGYTSLGALNIRNDIRGFKIKVNQKFLKRKVQLSASMERERNNVGSLNTSTEITNNYSLNIKFNFKNFPYLILDYRPNYVYNEEGSDSLKVDYNSSVFTIMTGLNDFTDDYYNSTNLLISTVNNNASSDASDYKILNFLISSNLSFVKFPLTLAVSAGYTFNNSTENSRIVSFDLSGSYLFFKKMNNTIGLSYLGEKDRNEKFGVYFITAVPLWDVADFYLRAEQNFYREKVYEFGDNNEFILTATLSKNLNLW